MQCIKINNSYANNKKVHFGVPQGSAMGALLFIMFDLITGKNTPYTNDMNNLTLGNLRKK